MQFAKLEWINNQPYSLDFNDVYFNSQNGLQETEYVFIEHNQLKARFSSLEKESFTVIETGFGTGLNFLAVATYWLALAPANAQLHYISIEKYPLTLTDLKRAHVCCSQFSAISNKLAKHYALLKAGKNVFNMIGDRIQLALHVDDISYALPLVSQKADAWLLDGFAPAKNAEMWSEKVFQNIAELSNPNATFATFTSASAVRRGLQAVGFQVKKHAGFGKKREMLSGIFAADAPMIKHD